MKTILLSLLLVFPSGTGLFAIVPQALELKSNGRIAIRTDGFGEIEIRPEVASCPGWKRIAPTEKISPDSGNEVRWTASFPFPDGSIVAYSLNAKIKGSDVIMDASWETTSSAQGFSRVDLWIPEDEVNDLTIETDGKPVFTAPGKPAFFWNVSEVVYKRTSTGQFLFRVTGEIPHGQVQFSEELREQGLTLRIFNLPNPNLSTIGDATKLGWTLSFKE